MFKLIEPRQKPIAILAPAVAWVIVTAIGMALHPDESGHGTHRQLGLPPCPSVMMWGRPCPACGLTTSWTHLLHGQFAESFSCNALGPLLYLVFTFYALGHVAAFLMKKEWNTDTKLINYGSIALFGSFLIYGGIRFAHTKYPGIAAIDIYTQNRDSGKAR